MTNALASITFRYKHIEFVQQQHGQVTIDLCQAWTCPIRINAVIYNPVHLHRIDVESSHQSRVTFDKVVVIHITELVGIGSRRVVIAIATTTATEILDGNTLLDIAVINVAACSRLVNDTLKVLIT